MNDIPTVGSDQKVAVRYVGTKEVKYDNVCRTQTVWRGTGDVQLVPIEVAAKLAQFPNVWELVRSAGSPEAPVPTAGLQKIRIDGDQGFASWDPITDVVEPDAAAAARQRPVLTLPVGRKGRR